MLTLPTVFSRITSSRASPADADSAVPYLHSLTSSETSTLAARTAVLDDIKRSVQRYLGEKLGPAKYQVAAEFFAAIVAGGLVTNAAPLPVAVQPLVNAYIAALAFSAAAKISEFALGKSSYKHFMLGLHNAIKQAQYEFRREAQLAIRDEAIENGISLSATEVDQMLKELLPDLRPAQLAGIVAVGGSIFTGLGYIAVGLGTGVAAAGLTGVPAAAAQAGLALLPNMAGGAVLVALNEKLLGLQQPRGSTLVAGGSLATAGIAGIVNAALPKGTSESAKTLLTGTAVGLASLLLLRFKDPMMNRLELLQQYLPPAIRGHELVAAGASTASNLEQIGRINTGSFVDAESGSAGGRQQFFSTEERRVITYL